MRHYLQPQEIKLTGMTLIHIIVFLATGIVVGFIGGLLGIGGGIILIPVQYAVFVSAGTPADTAIKMALGTSLLVVLPIAVSGALRHHGHGAVDWKAATTMGIISSIASFGASAMAARLPGAALKIAFGVIVLVSAIRMFSSATLSVEQKPRSRPWQWMVWALPIGIISGLFGVGGGFVAIPIMTLALRFRLHEAVGTSLAMMIFTSLGGVIGYIVNGLGVPNLPAYSIGYVNLLAWLSLSVTSTGMAQVGAIAAHRVPAKQLRIIFIVLLFYVGLKMLGVFEWLHLPI